MFNKLFDNIVLDLVIEVKDVLEPPLVCLAPPVPIAVLCHEVQVQAPPTLRGLSTRPLSHPVLLPRPLRATNLSNQFIGQAVNLKMSL